MFQPRSPRSTRSAPSFASSRYRGWAIAGVAAFLLLVAFTVIGGLLPDGGDTTTPAVTGTATTGDGSFLSDGYAELDGAESNDGGITGWGLIGGIILPLLVVIALVYGVLRALRYFNARVAASSSQSKLLESLDSLSLGQHGSVHLIRVGERVMAVGAGGQQVSLLSELEGEQASELIAAHRAQLERTAAAGNQVIESFRDALQRRMPAPASEPVDVPVPAAWQPSTFDAPPPVDAEQVVDVVDLSAPPAATTPEAASERDDDQRRELQEMIERIHARAAASKARRQSGGLDGLDDDTLALGGQPLPRFGAQPPQD